VANSIVLRAGESVTDERVMQEIGLPCFIKPSVGGSSFGVTKVKTQDQIQEAIAKAFGEGEEVMIEAYMQGIEVTSGMYKTKTATRIFPITEVVTDNEFFDYDAKYNGQVDEITPARVSDEITRQVQQTTEKIYRILNAKGIIRVDYIIDAQDRINLLEVNTTPGMTATSFIPQQVRAAGLDIADVMTEIIENEFHTNL
jgi:D-alanine-D-alanine ligase